MRKAKKAKAAIRVRPDAPELTPFEAFFVEAYILNGGNATRAYRTAHGGGPSSVKDSTCAVEGCKLLRLPKIRAALGSRQQERFKALQMEGDEALALIALRARANLADAYDERGQLLPFHLWPESLQLAVRWRINENGHLEVQHADGLKAAELMAIASGKLKTNVLQVQFDHASYLAGLDTPPAERETHEM
jgi:phage terminase small subunit